MEGWPEAEVAGIHRRVGGRVLRRQQVLRELHVGIVQMANNGLKGKVWRTYAIPVPVKISEKTSSKSPKPVEIRAIREEAGEGNQRIVGTDILRKSGTVAK